MRFSRSAPAVRRLEEVFYCRGRRRDVSLEQCLDRFVDANAFKNQSSTCMNCHIGLANRKRFAGTCADA